MANESEQHSRDGCRSQVSDHLRSGPPVSFFRCPRFLLFGVAQASCDHGKNKNQEKKDKGARPGAQVEHEADHRSGERARATYTTYRSCCGRKSESDDTRNQEARRHKHGCRRPNQGQSARYVIPKVQRENPVPLGYMPGSPII